MQGDGVRTRAFVSGSTQGIGFAIALGLLEDGMSVVINGRSQASVDGALRRLESAVPGAEVTGLAADLGDAVETSRLISALGDVDVLVNNVGVFGVDTFESVADTSWQRYVEVNLMSGVRLSRALLPGMLARDRGRIVFIASESGVDVPADMVPYGVTKAATIALANGLAKIARGTSVTVNSVLGGPTYSDGVAAIVESIAEAQSIQASALKDRIIAGRPTSLLGRFIDPVEIANLVRYLAGPRSSATTGAALRADGGVLTTIL